MATRAQPMWGSSSEPSLPNRCSTAVGSSSVTTRPPSPSPSATLTMELTARVTSSASAHAGTVTYTHVASVVLSQRARSRAADCCGVRAGAPADSSRSSSSPSDGVLTRPFASRSSAGAAGSGPPSSAPSPAVAAANSASTAARAPQSAAGEAAAKCPTTPMRSGPLARSRRSTSRSTAPMGATSGRSPLASVTRAHHRKNSFELRCRSGYGAPSGKRRPQAPSRRLAAGVPDSGANMPCSAETAVVASSHSSSTVQPACSCSSACTATYARPSPPTCQPGNTSSNAGASPSPSPSASASASVAASTSASAPRVAAPACSATSSAQQSATTGSGSGVGTPSSVGLAAARRSAHIRSATAGSCHSRGRRAMRSTAASTASSPPGLPASSTCMSIERRAVPHMRPSSSLLGKRSTTNGAPSATRGGASSGWSHGARANRSVLLASSVQRGISVDTSPSTDSSEGALASAGDAPPAPALPPPACRAAFMVPTSTANVATRTSSDGSHRNTPPGAAAALLLTSTGGSRPPLRTLATSGSSTTQPKSPWHLTSTATQRPGPSLVSTIESGEMSNSSHSNSTPPSSWNWLASAALAPSSASSPWPAATLASAISCADRISTANSAARTGRVSHCAAGDSCTCRSRVALLIITGWSNASRRSRRNGSAPEVSGSSDAGTGPYSPGTRVVAASPPELLIWYSAIDALTRPAKAGIAIASRSSSSSADTALPRTNEANRPIHHDVGRAAAVRTSAARNVSAPASPRV
mmetsp:Transcript_16268/g.56822  ORF Transcript_16268/g.56822 Transcript_16268/m.56822 type:complete len:758 (+) Transcript_16268:1498-3771(+)